MPLFRARRTGNWLKMADDGELDVWKIEYFAFLLSYPSWRRAGA